MVHETYDEELAWLADRVLETHTAMAQRTDDPSWRRSVSSPGTTPTPPPSSTP